MVVQLLAIAIAISSSYPMRGLQLLRGGGCGSSFFSLVHVTLLVGIVDSDLIGGRMRRLPEQIVKVVGKYEAVAGYSFVINMRILTRLCYTDERISAWINVSSSTMVR